MTEVIDYPHFLHSEIEQGQPEDALFHVIPVPYENSVSYGGGTCFGPSAILQASGQLEVWDGKSRPSDEGIYTSAPVDCSGEPIDVMDNIAESVSKTLSLGKIPVVLGGEHSVTWGVIKAFLDAGIEDIGVVQVDAHADLRHAYEGNPYSHASVMKRIVEQGVPLYQLGVRAYCEEEMQARKAFAVHHLDGSVIVPNAIEHIHLPENFPRHVFFTLDVDGMDPSVFPSTGTPVPGGLGWYQTLSLFESVAKQRNIVGFDIMEFSPIPGFHAYDFACALLTHQMMGITQRHRTP